MSIHTLHDLCYAYSVADPVREMLFALQDRIDELEAQRKPLTDEAIEQAQRDVWRSLPSDFDYTTSSWIEIGIRYAEAAHGIKEGT